MLEKIKTPQDIEKLTFTELATLARDVRQRIIEVTSKNGGHLAPSLGATDLIIAILKVFNPLTDSIVFDVGHQAYAYKILTERNDRFDTLRTFGGISGFNNIFESRYDAFTVGHSSTSISATLGINIAKHLQNIKGTAIAVIGDGALTGGMAFEAINHAGHLQKNMIVILNDNEMSISENVGALQHYMTNVLVSKSYNAVKKRVWDLAQSLPKKLKNTFITGAQRIEESVMNVIAPTIFFEDLGFKYVGPINGHDIPRMCRIFRQVRDNIEGPVLIHLLTQKGKGLSFAETNSAKFHGIGPFDSETGAVKGIDSGQLTIDKDGDETKIIDKKIDCDDMRKSEYTAPACQLSTVNCQLNTWSQVFGDKLVSMAKKNKEIVAITAAMTDGTGLNDFAKEYPNRFFDVGIAEQHAVTFAAGMASKGIRPFVAIYSTFLQRAIDQIIHDVALPKLPVVLCIDRAGLVGEDGATHQGVFDLSYLQFIPNLTIVAPATADQLEQTMEWAMSVNDRPVAIRYPRGVAHRCSVCGVRCSETEYSTAGDDFDPKTDTADIHHRGKTIAITGVGHSFHIACQLYGLIIKADQKTKPYLINPLFIKPYDKAIYDEIYDKCKFHIVIEENAQIGSFASRLSLDYSLSKCQTLSFAIPDRFIEHGNVEMLRDMLDFTAAKIYDRLKELGIGDKG